MPESDFSLPRSSYPELLKIVHAYFLADSRSKGEPVSISDVASRAATNRTVVSRNNNFLSSIGIIQGGQKKTLTEVGRALGLAVSHDDEASREAALSRIVDESEFLGRVTHAVRIRSGMDVPSLQSHIAISAGVQKTRDLMTGAAAVINLLLDSGHLVDDGGTIRAADRKQQHRAVEEVAAPEGMTITTAPTTTSYVPSIWNSTGYTYSYPVQQDPRFTINVNINTSVDDLDAVAEFLRTLLQPPGEGSEVTED